MCTLLLFCILDRDIVYDSNNDNNTNNNNKMISPCQVYDYTIVVYTYGKSLLTPGQRMGWIAIPPSSPTNVGNDLFNLIEAILRITGWSIPSVIPGHSLIRLEKELIDKYFNINDKNSVINQMEHFILCFFHQ